MKRFPMIVAACLVASLLLAGSAQAINYFFSIKDEPVYPTCYYDHSGYDWNCGTFVYSGHRGSDYGIGSFPEMDKGRIVQAAAAGTVIEAHDGEYDRCTSGSCSPPNGNYVKIEHDDGKMTYYLHMRQWSVNVSVGDRVFCGKQLGQVGSSGYSTGPHIHFQVWTPSYGTDDPFAGDCGGPLSYWVSQGPYMGVPARTCDPAGCGTIISTAGSGEYLGGAATIILLVPAFFAVALRRGIRKSS